MPSPKLPPLEENPEFKINDAKACKQWLETVPLTNTWVAHAEITQQLRQLSQIKVPLREHLKILEQLREPVAFVQEGLAKRYLGKPVPFEAAEQGVWDKVCLLWQAMGEGYQVCLQGCLDGDAEVLEHIALITQRCMRYISLQMLEHYRTYRWIEGALWRQLHILYAYAEEQGFSGRAVKDSLNEMVEATTCNAAYVHASLMSLVNPYQFSYRQLALLDRWLDKWGGRVPLTTACPTLSPLSVLVADLDSSAAPALLSEACPPGNPRYLDTARLAEGIRKRIKFLRKGGSPAELDVGEECNQPGCEVFLTALYKQWCETPISRASERRSSAAMAHVCFGMPVLHFFINDEKPLDQPGKTESVGWQEVQELQMFGRISERAENSRVAKLGYALETWKIQDESALGFCMARQLSGNYQISHSQLLALRPDDASQFLLGVVRWLMLTSDGELQIGVRTILGSPIAIGIRPVALNLTAQNVFVPALLLPEVSALQAQPSLVIPTGIFQPGKLLEIHGEERYTVKMQSLIEKGADFERVSFVKT